MLFESMYRDRSTAARRDCSSETAICRFLNSLGQSESRIAIPKQPLLIAHCSTLFPKRVDNGSHHFAFAFEYQFGIACERMVFLYCTFVKIIAIGRQAKLIQNWNSSLAICRFQNANGLCDVGTTNLQWNRTIGTSQWLYSSRKRPVAICIRPTQLKIDQLQFGNNRWRSANDHCYW